MKKENPYCDICGDYCEIEWNEIKSVYRIGDGALKEKRTVKTIVCSSCKYALIELIKSQKKKT